MARWQRKLLDVQAEFFDESAMIPAHRNSTETVAYGDTHEPDTIKGRESRAGDHQVMGGLRTCVSCEHDFGRRWRDLMQ